MLFKCWDKALNTIFERFGKMQNHFSGLRLSLFDTVNLHMKQQRKMYKGKLLSWCRDQNQLKVHALFMLNNPGFFFDHWAKTYCRNAGLLIFYDRFNFETQRGEDDTNNTKDQKLNDFILPPLAFVTHFFISVPRPLVLTSRKEVGRPHPSEWLKIHSPPLLRLKMKPQRCQELPPLSVRLSYRPPSSSASPVLTAPAVTQPHFTGALLGNGKRNKCSINSKRLPN